MKHGRVHHNQTGFGCYLPGKRHVMSRQSLLALSVKETLAHPQLLLSSWSICAVANGVNISLWLILDARACARMA